MEIHHDDGKFDSATDADLFENAEEIVFNGMLADVEPPRYLAIALCCRNKAGDLVLSLGKAQARVGRSMERR